AWKDLVPIFSWLSTRGKCRYCHAPIAPRYMYVEILCGVLFAALWWQYAVATEQGARMFAYMAATGALVAVVFIDWELYIIPDELNAFFLPVGALYHLYAKTLPTFLWGAFAGWALIWGIAFLGRTLLGKDAMGHGDIKLMRGVGAVLGALLTGASVIAAVFAGLIIGVALIFVDKKRTQKAVARAAAEPGEATLTGESNGDPVAMEEYPPETIPHLLKMGVFYLLCLDVIGIFIPAVYRLFGEEPEEVMLEEDDWKPTITTIPFGPYLALGAIACMLFAAPIQQGIEAYWANATGANIR
ncbi:prepilin peptidase, partial [bacterium]